MLESVIFSGRELVFSIFIKFAVSMTCEIVISSAMDKDPFVFSSLEFILCLFSCVSERVKGERARTVVAGAYFFRSLPSRASRFALRDSRSAIH